MTMKLKVKKHSLKFLSLFLSLFLWAYILNSEKLSFEKIVYLDYILPEDMIFSQKPPQEVIFNIEGPRAFIKTVLDRDDRILIDLNRVNQKKQLSFYVDFNSAQLNLPFGMIVENVSLRRIPIKLERKFTKILPLKLEYSSSFPEGFSFQKFQVTASEVEVQGPKSILESLRSISTRPIDFDSLIGHDSLVLEPVLPDDRLSFSRNEEIKINYVLKLNSTELLLKDIPIKFLSKNKNIFSKIKKASVRVKLDKIALKNRSNISSSVQIWADISASKTGEVNIPLNVVLPPGVELLEVNPKSILVNIQ